MLTDKYDLHTTDYSVQGWDTILTTDMEKLDAVIPSRELVTLGETVVAYQAAYFAAVDSKWYKAQANGTSQPAHGLFLEGGDEDDEVRIHRMGVVTNAGWAWASLGAPVYLKDDVAGGLTQAPPAANKQIIGYAISATSMLVVSLPQTLIDAATYTASGVVELATAAEINTGTDTGRAISPDALADSNFGKRIEQLQIFAPASTVTTGTNKYFYRVGSVLNGMNLVGVAAACVDVGETGTTTVRLHRLRIEFLGDSTTQFDVTNPAGATFRYTYDGTGLNPNIADSDIGFRIGDILMIYAENFASGNQGYFAITGVGNNYFEVDNASGVAESNKTIGSGFILSIKDRWMLSTDITFTIDIDSESIYEAPPVINTELDDVLTGDKLFIDVSTVHSGTPPNGLTVELQFALP